MERDQMEQKNHQKPVLGIASLHRLRSQGKRLSITRASNSKWYLWEKQACDRIPECDEENVTVKEDGSTVKMRSLAQERVPPIVIRDQNNAIIESSGRIGVLDTESANNQCPSGSKPYFRTLNRRSHVSHSMNTESLSQKDTSPTVYGGDKIAKTSTKFSPATFPSGNQDGSSKAEPQESLGLDFGLKFRSRFRRRSSSLLLQKERLQTKEKNEENEYFSGSLNRKEDERIYEEKTANYGSSHLTRSTSKMDKQQEVACEKSENEADFGAERKGHADTKSNLVCKSQSNQWTLYTSLGHSDQHKDPQATNKAGREKSQECRRMLQFESDHESQDSKEHTAPLTMMAQTPVISRTSTLQNPANQKQQKEVMEPVVKRSLLDLSVKTSRFKRRWHRQIHHQAENSSEQSYQNKELKILTSGAFVSNKCESSPYGVLFEHRQEPESMDIKHALGNTTVSKFDATLGGSTEACTGLNSVTKVKFLQHSGPTKRIQRRRSAAVLGVRTPLRKICVNSDAKSASKYIGSSFSSKIPTPRESQNHGRQRRSLALTDHLLKNQPTDKTAVSNCEGLDKESKVQRNMSEYKSHKVDASTNTTISLAHIKNVDLKILEDIENLLVERDELNNKAHLLQEKTATRCREMKERRLMESFMTSLSPLRRLKAVFSENHEGTDSGSGCQEDPQHWKPDGGAVVDGDAQKPQVTVNKSEMEWLCSREAPVTSDHKTQWRRRHQANRLIRTSWDSTAEDEEFLDAEQGSRSPFTILVGDCERPSLAPMTPHSRHHVSLLKLSLKEQMEQLYEN